jgi:hypothetical protein
VSLEGGKPVLTATFDGGADGGDAGFMSDGVGDAEASARSAVLSDDGDTLAWDDGSVWKRTPKRPEGVSGPWYDESGRKQAIEPVGSQGDLVVRDSSGSETAKGKAKASKDGKAGVDVQYTDGQKGAGSVSPDGEKLVWDDGKVWRRAAPHKTVGGTWYDAANNRRKIEANPTAVEAASVQDALNREVDELISRLGKGAEAGSDAGHASHQLFELQPTLGLDVSAEADGKGLRVLGVEPAAGGRGAGPARGWRPGASGRFA